MTPDWAADYAIPTLCRLVGVELFRHARTIHLWRDERDSEEHHRETRTGSLNLQDCTWPARSPFPTNPDQGTLGVVGKGERAGPRHFQKRLNSAQPSSCQFSKTRCSACQRTARDRTCASTSWPMRIISLGVTACVTRRTSCFDDRPLVERRRDVMGRCADDFDTPLISLVVRSRPFETGQKRMVNVDAAAFQKGRTYHSLKSACSAPERPNQPLDLGSAPETFLLSWGLRLL